MGTTHLEGLRRAGVPVRGVLASSPAKGERFAAEQGLPRAYGSLDELLADDSVAAVHILTPNALHDEQCQQAIAAGKHVLCEKPLAVNAEQSARLVALANEHPELILAVNYNCRFYPLCIETQTRIAQGDLGRIVHACGSYVQDWLLKPTDYNWRVLESAGGPLRAVADIGTHWLDLVQWMTGTEVVSVCANLQIVHPTRQRPRGEVQTFARETTADTEPVEITTDDFGSILLEFESGSRGCVWVSQTTAGRKNALRFELAGTAGSAAWDGEDPNGLWLGSRDEANRLLIKDPGLMTAPAASAASYPGGHAEGYPDTFKQVMHGFYGAIEARRWPTGSPLATFADGHREILLCEAILTSHRQRRWVALEEIAG
jgi:predicted dehydrogenase